MFTKLLLDLQGKGCNLTPKPPENKWKIPVFLFYVWLMIVIVLQKTNPKSLYYSSVPPTMLSKIIHACCFWFIQSLYAELLCFLSAHCHLIDINHAYCILRKHIYLHMGCDNVIHILVKEEMWAGSTHMACTYSELFSVLVQGSCNRKIQRMGFNVCKVCCGDLGEMGWGLVSEPK